MLPTAFVIDIALNLLQAAMGDGIGEGDEEAKRRLAKDLDFWIADNRRHLNDDAIRTLREMGAADQRRVIGGGELEICKDIGRLFRTRVCMGRQREQDLAERKGVDASKFARDASPEEVETWLLANSQYIDELAKQEFDALAGDDKWRIISEGPLREHVDPAFAIQQRAQRSSELASEVVEIFQRRQQQMKHLNEPKLPPAPTVVPRVAAMIQKVYTSYVGTEVPAHQRRCAGFGKPPEPEKPPLVGNTKGIGGVIEVLKQKYGCSKSQRLTVIGEKGGPAGLWLLDTDKSVPKTHWKEGGWKWVLETEEPPKLRPQAEQAHIQQEEPGKQVAEKVEDKNEEKKEERKRERSRSHTRSSRHRRDTDKSSGKSRSGSGRVKQRRKTAKEKGKHGSRARRRHRRSSTESASDAREARASSHHRSGGRRK